MSCAPNGSLTRGADIASMNVVAFVPGPVLASPTIRTGRRSALVGIAARGRSNLSRNEWVRRRRLFSSDRTDGQRPSEPRD